MFTRDEALALWDDLNTDKDAFLNAFGELVLSRTINDINEFRYFIRAKNTNYIKEMFEAYNRICEKHGVNYRINDKGEIIFYKEIKRDTRRL